MQGTHLERAEAVGISENEGYISRGLKKDMQSGTNHLEK